MARRTLMSDRLDQVSPPKPLPVKPPVAEVTTPVAAKRPPSREGTRGATVWLKPDTFKSLKRLAVDQDTTIHALLLDAVDRTLELYGKPTP